jgi:hypothetical protein
MESEDFHVKPAACPTCGKVLDAAMSLYHKEPPEAGCLTVCIYCGTALKFDADGGLQRLSDDDLAEIALEDPATFSLVVKTQNVVGLFRLSHPSGGGKR